MTTYSLISAGTEKMLIDIAKKSMIGKAKARPDLIKQVLNKIKKEGLIHTVQKVMTKLEVPIPLGYSSTGTVMVAGRNMQGIQAGDRVACAGAIPMDHWIQNPRLGGGRIIGEVCHFIDFMQYINSGPVVSVFASAIRTDNKNYSNNDSVQITLEFENGSIGNISYHALGDSSLPKEYFEVSAGGFTAKLYDFKRTDMVYEGKLKRFTTRSQDKGFLNEYSEFLKSVRGEIASPIEFRSLFITTMATFRILESIQTGLKLNI